MGDLVRVENGIALLTPETAQKVADYERAIKRLKEQEDALKTAILREMEAYKVIKLESDDVTITYVAATERETFDAKALRAANPDLYDEYIRFTPVKASIRVKVNG